MKELRIRSPRRRAAITFGVLSMLAACAHPELPAPITGLPLMADVPGVASLELLDGFPESGVVRVSPRGLTSSLASWGKGGRLHVTFQFVNDSGQLLRFQPFDARLRDLGNVEIRLLELRVGDEAPRTVEVAPGQTVTADLLFGGTILRGPHRWDRLKLNWSYLVGDLEVQRVAVFEQAEDVEGPGPWTWVPEANPGHAPLRSPRWERGPDAGS